MHFEARTHLYTDNSIHLLTSLLRNIFKSVITADGERSKDILYICIFYLMTHLVKILVTNSLTHLYCLKSMDVTTYWMLITRQTVRIKNFITSTLCSKLLIPRYPFLSSIVHSYGLSACLSVCCYYNLKRLL